MQCSLRRRALAALLAGLLALDLVLNLWWHNLGKPLKDLHVGCKAAAADLPSLGRRVAGSERVLLLTVLRHEQAEEATNFLAHVKAAGLLPRLLAVVLDEPSAALAVEYGVTAYRVRIRGMDAPRPAAVCAAGAEEWLDSSAQVQAARLRSTKCCAGRCWHWQIRALRGTAVQTKQYSKQSQGSSNDR